jgi:hypothetical protein
VSAGNVPAGAPPARSGVWSRAAVLAAAVAASVVLIVVYVAAGGTDYKPASVADPCKPREWRTTNGFQGLADQVARSAADGAACRLGVSREELVTALASPGGRQQFIREHGLSQEEVDQAVRAGLDRAIDDARRAGAIGGIEEFLLRQAVKGLPVDFLLDRLLPERG